MLCAGLTGGIGSGKSTVARVFEQLGVAVYYTDTRARELMVDDRRRVDELTALLGPEVYRDGGLDKAVVAAKIFNDRELIARVNAIVHPRVADDFRDWVGRQSGDYVVMECAILFESGFETMTDYVVTVSAPVDERVERAAGRDGVETAQVRRRMANQMDDAEREARADFTIMNAEGDAVLPRVLELHKFFTDEGRKR
jgi:dephospho-CoA kinase